MHYVPSATALTRIEIPSGPSSSSPPSSQQCSLVLPTFPTLSSPSASTHISSVPPLPAPPQNNPPPSYISCLHAFVPQLGERQPELWLSPRMCLLTGQPTLECFKDTTSAAGRSNKRHWVLHKALSYTNLMYQALGKSKILPDRIQNICYSQGW